MYALYLQLKFTMLVGIFLEGVADIERLFRFDIFCLTALTECYAVEYFIRHIIDKLKFYMFLTTTDDLACSVVADVMCAEYRLGVVRTMRREFLEVVEELACYLMETNFGIDLLLAMSVQAIYSE